MRAGKMRHLASVQSGTAVGDGMGGIEEDGFRQFTTWPVEMEPKPFVNSESQAAMLYPVTGRYRRDIFDRFRAGETIRLVVDGLTLKVMAIEDVQGRHRAMKAHCGLAEKTA